MTTLADMAEQLRLARQQAGLSQAELAQRAGVSRTTLARMETLAPDFVSLAMPVREQPWRWPRDLHPFFRQNLPEGFLRRAEISEPGRTA